MSKKSPEFKNLGFEIKNVDVDKGVIEGYAATFGNIDLGDDVIEFGAFEKTIKESRGVWPILDHHDVRERLGYNREASEDQRGLRVVEQLAMDVQKARDTVAMTKLALDLGGKDGLSIGFLPIQSEPDRDRPQVRRLKEIKMMEHSHVTFGMNPEAFTLAAKSWQYQSDLGLKDHTDLFFRQMEKMGYKYEDVKQALSGAAKNQHDPDQAIVQSADRLLNMLKVN
jgi:hypothetical protein